MEEIWLESPYPFRGYLVSNMGGIKCKKGRFWVMKRIRLDKDCYLTTYIYNEEKNIETTMRVHRLVAMTFLPNPNNLPVVNHKNGIKYDNRASNLEWMTISENTKDGTQYYDSAGSRRVKVTIPNGSEYYYSSYAECSKALGGINRNIIQKYIDKKVLLDFLTIESTDILNGKVNTPLISDVNLASFHPVLLNGVSYINCKEAGEKTNTNPESLRYAIRTNQTNTHNITSITPLTYLKNTNKLLIDI